MSGSTVAIIAYIGNLLGILITKFGLFLQKLTHMDMEKECGANDQAKPKPIYYRVQWIVGLGLLLFGGAMQVVALPYADLVLISTNAITAIVFNTFLSIKYLGEQFIWRYDVPAFSLMGIGAVVIVLMASTTEKRFNPDEIKALLTSPPSLVCSAIGGTFMFGTLVYMNIFL